MNASKLDRMVTLMVTKTQQRQLKTISRKHHMTQQALLREALASVLARHEATDIKTRQENEYDLLLQHYHGQGKFDKEGLFRELVRTYGQPVPPSVENYWNTRIAEFLVERSADTAKPQAAGEPVVEIIERWYDRRTRNWIVQLKDKDENQIGAADYLGHKDDALSTVAHYRALYPNARVVKS